jgi:hypothetical protein
LGVDATLTRGPGVQSCLYCADAAIRSGEFPVAGTPAGTLAVRTADLQVHGSRSVTATGTAPSKGEMTVFARPVLTAPAFVKGRQRAGGRVAAGPCAAGRSGGAPGRRDDRGDRGEGAADGAAAAAGTAPPHVVSPGHPPCDRDDAVAGRIVFRGGAGAGRAARGRPVHPGMARPGREDRDGMAAADPGGGDGGDLLARGRAADRR